jgi:hypothetical protein
MGMMGMGGMGMGGMGMGGMGMGGMYGGGMVCRLFSVAFEERVVRHPTLLANEKLYSYDTCVALLFTPVRSNHADTLISPPSCSISHRAHACLHHLPRCRLLAITALPRDISEATVAGGTDESSEGGWKESTPT